MTTENLTPIQSELLSRADSILNSIGSAVGKATDFAATQIPDIAMQYVGYGRAHESFLMFLGFTFLITGLYLLIALVSMNVYKWPNDRLGEWDARRGVACIIGAVSAVVGFVVVLTNIGTFMMVWFAPKIWLIIEMAKLIKMVK